MDKATFWILYWGCPQEKETSSRVETTDTVVRGVLSEVAVAGGKGCEHLKDEVAETFSMGLRRKNLKKCPGNKRGDLK